MNISLTLLGFALALLVPEIVEAEGGGGRVEFSGAVVEPTCQTISQSVSAVPDPRNVSTRIGQCVIAPASAHPQVVLYVSSTRTLRTNESDQLLHYLVEQTTAAGTAASARLQTVTYL